MTYLFWAYTVVWIILAAYLGWLGYRLLRLQVRLERLEHRLRDRRSDTN